MCILSSLEHSRSARTSDYLNVYLLLSLLCDAAQVRTLWLLGLHGVLAPVASACMRSKVLLLFLEVRGKDFILLDKYKNLTPEALSGVFSRMLFWWLNPLFLRGFRSTLGQDDMFQIDDALRSETLGRKFCQSCASSEPGKPSTTGWASRLALKSFFKKHKLFWTTLRDLKGPLMAAIPPRACLIALNYTQPFLINDIVDSIGKENNQPNRLRPHCRYRTHVHSHRHRYGLSTAQGFQIYHNGSGRPCRRGLRQNNSIDCRQNR